MTQPLSAGVQEATGIRDLNLLNVTEFLQVTETPTLLVERLSGVIVKWLTTRLLNDSTRLPTPVAVYCLHAGMHGNGGQATQAIAERNGAKFIRSTIAPQKSRYFIHTLHPTPAYLFQSTANTIPSMSHKGTDMIRASVSPLKTPNCLYSLCLSRARLMMTSNSSILTGLVIKS